jgi:hypothetical protein
MKTLLLHHFETHWEDAMRADGTSFDEQLHKILDYLSEANVGKVIVTRFSGNNLEDVHYPLQSACENLGIQLTVHEYGYGWSREDDSHYKEGDLNKSWCFGGRGEHTEKNVLQIEDWQHQLHREESVIVAGAFEDACINDLETVFTAIDLVYQREDSLIVGACVPYHWNNTSPEKLDELIEGIIAEVTAEAHALIDTLDSEHDHYCSDLDELFEVSPDEVINLEARLVRVFEQTEELRQRYDKTYESDDLFDAVVESLSEDGDFEYFSDRDIPVEAVEFAMKTTIATIEDDVGATFDGEVKLMAAALESPFELGQMQSDLFELYSDLKERFGESLLHDADITQHTSVYLIDELWEKFEDKGRPVDISILTQLGKKAQMRTIEGIHYHGSAWTPDQVFTDLDPEFGSLGVVYVSDVEEVATRFAENTFEESDQIKVILQYDIALTDIYRITDPTVLRYQGQEYNVSGDREEYFPALSGEFNGAIIENNYEGHGHDIAVFNEQSLNQNLTGVKLKIDDEWTTFMSPEKAVSLAHQQFNATEKHVKKRGLR